jgi:FkbM family methyltransferase
MSILQGIRSYYSLFAWRGLCGVAKARIHRKHVLAVVVVPGLRHPVYLRLRTTDISVFRQVFVTAEYECEWLPSPRVIVDAGANIGLTSVFYANKYPNARIVAVEPERSNFDVMKKNIGPYPNIVGVHGALWKDNTDLFLMSPRARHDGFQTAEEPASGRANHCSDIRGITVDRLMADYCLEHIDLFKIDIEGSEREVFENPSAWIDRVGAIVIELHDGIRPGCSRSVYLAAKEFGFEHRKGETVFLLRGERLEHAAAQANTVRTQAQLPFKLLNVR